jgi:hypothetical protein
MKRMNGCLTHDPRKEQGHFVNNSYLSVMGGFQYAANYLFTSHANYTYTNYGGVNYDMAGALANQFMEGDLTARINHTATWRDPTDYMINQMRQLAFRTSLQAANDNPTASNATQTVEYVGRTSETVYETNFGFIAAAAALNLLAVLAIIPTYRGWWALGRQFSLSPLEIARAFDAPILRDTEYNSTWKQISELVGERSVRYRDFNEEMLSDDGIKNI